MLSGSLLDPVAKAIEAASGDTDGPLKYDSLFHTMRSAANVRTHLDYYRWLQTDINTYIPHRSVLAAWGDFKTGDMSFDLASSEGDTTYGLRQVTGLKPLLTTLFEKVQASGRSWTVLSDLHAKAKAHGLDLGSEFYQRHAVDGRALLVYVMRCERGGHDCMYIFSVSQFYDDFDPMLLDLMMPHIDAALRRVKCLGPRCDSDTEFDGAVLSDREHEVLNWVSEGKSNEEIGTILGISRNTVKNHLKRIFAKMGVTARSQAVRVYLESHA